MRIIKSVISIPQVRERDLLKICKQLNRRTSGDISLAVLVRYDGAIWQANCSKTGGGVGVRKQIETIWSSKWIQSRFSPIEETAIYAQNPVVEPRKTVRLEQFPTNGKHETMKSNSNSPAGSDHPQQRLSFSFPAFSEQTLSQQAIQLKTRDVVVFEKPENRHNHYHFWPGSRDTGFLHFAFYILPLHSSFCSTFQPEILEKRIHATG